MFRRFEETRENCGKTNIQSHRVKEGGAEITRLCFVRTIIAFVVITKATTLFGSDTNQTPIIAPSEKNSEEILAGAIQVKDGIAEKLQNNQVSYDDELKLQKSKESIQIVFDNPRLKQKFKSLIREEIEEESSLLRQCWASRLQQAGTSHGIDIYVTTFSENNTTISIKYALMSDSFVLSLRNKEKVSTIAKGYGFKKVIYTDLAVQ